MKKMIAILGFLVTILTAFAQAGAAEPLIKNPEDINFWCNITGNGVFQSIKDDLGYAVASRVDIKRENNDLVIYHTPGDNYFNVLGKFAGLKINTSIAMNATRFQNDGKIDSGEISLNDVVLACSLRRK
jgi:hypothetical protein